MPLLSYYRLSVPWLLYGCRAASGLRSYAWGLTLQQTKKRRRRLGVEKEEEDEEDEEMEDEEEDE